MSQLPPFIAPSDDWRSRIRGLLSGTGRQRRGLALLAVVALVVGVITWMELRPREAPAPADGGPVTAEDVTAAATPRAAAGATAAVTVHVSGRVSNPGIHRLPAGSRVADAVAAAGGSASGADLERLNLARKLVDGEQIQVPLHGQPIPPPPPGPAGAGGTEPQRPIDLNTATAEQLEELPGVGEVTAERIIAHRTERPFRSVEDLLDVEGIGERRLEALRDLVVVAG